MSITDYVPESVQSLAIDLTVVVVTTYSSELLALAQQAAIGVKSKAVQQCNKTLFAISSVAPLHGNCVGNEWVTITGYGFTDKTTVMFGDVPPKLTRFVSSTSIKVRTPLHQKPGSVPLRVLIKDTMWNNTFDKPFTFYARPTVTSITPSMCVMQGGNGFVIDGTDFTAESIVRIGNSQLTVTAQNDKQLTVNLPDAKTEGIKQLCVLNPGENNSSSNLPIEYIAAPQIVRVEVAKHFSRCNESIVQSKSHETIHFIGTGFHAQLKVTIDGNECTPKNVNSTSFDVENIDLDVGEYVVTCENPLNGVITWNKKLTVCPAPTIDSAIITSGLLLKQSIGSCDGNENVKITGSNFDKSTTIRFGNTLCKILSLDSDTELTILTPKMDAGETTLTADNGHKLTGQWGSTFRFARAPKITSVVSVQRASLSFSNLLVCNAKSTVRVQGSQFEKGIKVWIDDVEVTKVQLKSNVQLEFEYTPSKAGNCVLKLVNPWELSCAFNDALLVVEAPELESVSPTLFPFGGTQTLTLTGKHFHNSMQVYCHNTLLPSPRLDSATSAKVELSCGTIGKFRIRLKHYDNLECSLDDAVEIVRPPQIDRIEVSGRQGQWITNVLCGASEQATIFGEYFTNPVTVTIDGQSATIVSQQGTDQIVVTVPTLQTTKLVDLVVTNNNNLTSTKEKALQFVKSPTVTKLSQDTGLSCGGQFIDILGTDFMPSCVVSFGSIQASETQFVSDTELKVKTPAHCHGPVDIKVVNPNTLEGTLVSCFTFEKVPVLAGSVETIVPYDDDFDLKLVGVFSSSNEIKWFLNNQKITPTYSLENEVNFRLSARESPSSNATDGVIKLVCGSFTVEKLCFRYRAKPVIRHALAFPSGRRWADLVLHATVIGDMLKSLRINGYQEAEHGVSGIHALCHKHILSKSGALLWTQLGEINGCKVFQILDVSMSRKNNSASPNNYEATYLNGIDLDAGCWFSKPSNNNDDKIISTFRTDDMKEIIQENLTVQHIFPDHCSPSSNCVIKLVGTGLENISKVHFGGTEATFNESSSTELMVTPPQNMQAGEVSIFVEREDGIVEACQCKFTVVACSFLEVIPSHGHQDAQDMVFIRGTGLERGAKVTFDTDDVDPSDVQVLSGELLMVKSPAHASGTVSVTVTPTETGNAITLNNAFTFDVI